MASDAPLVEVRGIVKHFGSVIALSGVSMTVARGEVLCLLGDNGAGKSTLIKILSGVYRPTHGDLSSRARRSPSRRRATPSMPASRRSTRISP